MAGLYDRIKAESDNIPVHELGAVLRLYARGDATKAQAKSALEELLTNPLTTDETNDLAAIADQIDATVNVLNKVAIAQDAHDYSALAQAGVSALTETVWRNRLGI